MNTKRFILLFCWLLFSIWDLNAQHKEVTRLEYRKIEENLQDARSIYITNIPRIYIVETGRHRFLELNAGGERVDSLGNQGFGDYQFDTPIDVDATNGMKIYVSDYNNGRVQIYDRRTQFLTSITSPPDNEELLSYRPTVLTVTDIRQLIFYDKENGRLIKYNQNGELESTLAVETDRLLNEPIDLDSSRERLFVADGNANVIHILTFGGQYQRFIGGVDDLKGFCISSEGSIWAVSGDYLHKVNFNGRHTNRFNLPPADEFRDIAVFEKRIYILTSNALFKASYK